MTDKRIIIGITFRVSAEADGVDPEVLRNAVQQHVDYWEDGRRSMFVEQALDCCQRMVMQAVRPDDRRDVDVAVYDLDHDTTVTVEPFPTLKTGKYRVICTSSRSEGAREGYALATRATFNTFEEAEEYARGISSSREPLIVVETERASL